MAAVTFDLSEGVALITLHAPPVNAITLPLLEGLIESLERAASDPDVRAVVLASALPRFFSAGLDLPILLEKSIEEVRAVLLALYPRLLDAQHNLRKPSIAALSGAARGGGMTMAVSCNLIVAGQDATFGYPEIDVGMLPAIHLGHLPRIVGRHQAFDLLFTGRTFTAAEAQRLGLVSRVVPDDRVLEETLTLAGLLARKSPSALAAARDAFMAVNDVGYRAWAAEAVEVFCRNLDTPNGREGLAAFAQKRAPDWS